ncbi:PH domain-containing protein [Erwinia phyllosphaerae]|uniref:PH domain-containing protein n=1 Tax=Erwinia phyllosphaerae TaxID=2853256 RepID=UPI001FEE59BE|nr:PH domain-containing protein [Erwinia phyllosphaerae]MBV4365089.1 PH domain-containing protein [Erwinia phyllosphaerae]
MAYIDSNLINNESLLYRGKVTLWALLPWIVWGVIFAVVTAGAGLLLIPLGYMIIRSNEAGITDKRVIAKTGLIKRDTIEIGLSKVSSLQVKQSILGRILGYGSLTVCDVGTSRAPIKYIKNPMEFRRRFFELQEKNGMN